MRTLILNRMGKESLFKPALLNLCGTEGNELILGYGFISLQVISNKKFIDAINCGFKDLNEKNLKGKITLIGCKDDDYVNYLVAGMYLEKNLINADVSVYIKSKRGKHRTYHKKIAIKRTVGKSREVSRCILGSSNLTNGPFNDTGYNQEVDVYMWNSFEISNKEEEQIINECCIEEYKDKYKNVIAKYRHIEKILGNSKIGLTLDLELQQVIDEINDLNNKGFKKMYGINDDKKIWNISDLTDDDINCLFNNVNEFKGEIRLISLGILLRLYKLEKIKLDLQNCLKSNFNTSIKKDEMIKYLESKSTNYGELVEIIEGF